MGAYKFITNKNVGFNTPILGRTFKNEWLEIKPSGVMIVSKGYAWNGCSPKWQIFDLMLGTPDGAIDQQTFKPITYFESMLHDALYQFKDSIPVTRKEVDLIFHQGLKQRKFLWSNVYFFFVRCFGGFYGQWLMK